MKSIIKFKPFLVAFIICLTATMLSDTSAACAQSSTSSKPATLTSVFKNSLGEYPGDINLLENNILKKRIIALIGQKRYDYLIENFQVQTPVEFSNFMYHTFACQAHNCGFTEFEICYIPKSDNLCVRYRVDDVERIFKEKQENASWDF